jgi:hypothetical protein
MSSGGADSVCCDRGRRNYHLLTIWDIMLRQLRMRRNASSQSKRYTNISDWRMGVLLETWRAESVVGKTGSGRTGPLIVSCNRETAEGLAFGDFVVKGIGLPEITEHHLFCECVGLLVAAALGVRVPPVALISIDHDFIDANRDKLLSLSSSLNAGTAVGSVFCRPTAPYLSDVNLTTREFRDAMWVYGSDVLLQNVDRVPHNHNCALFGDGILAFDYESSLSFLLALFGGGEPWKVSEHGISYRHLFYPLLRRADLDWEPFCLSVARLDLNLIAGNMGRMPASWTKSRADKVIVHLNGAILNAARLGDELVRSLA